MDNNPIHLTILRRGDVHIVDLAEVQAVIPRSETRVESGFLDEIGQELKRITNLVGPEFRKGTQAGDPEVRRNPRVVAELKNIGSLIFSHLLPQAARDRLRNSESCNLYLRLDDQLIHIPWELAFDGQQFLGMKFRVGRQVITHHKISQGAPTRTQSDILKVLIISDPSETLKNVSAESEQLCEILDRVPGLQVRLIGGRGVRRIPLLAALRESDVIHFAGHSQFDEKNPENSGWLLYDGLLSASEISKLDQAPLLVFSNSCQAGATKNWQGDYLFEGEAFGLGSAFLLAGVRNYVGTFCVVHDEESRFLAVEFYRRIAQGQSIGQALLEARLATAEEMGLERLTWASYMLYGDPNFSLTAETSSASSFYPADTTINEAEKKPEFLESRGTTHKEEQPRTEPHYRVLVLIFGALFAAVFLGYLLFFWWEPTSVIETPSKSSLPTSGPGQKQNDIGSAVANEEKQGIPVAVDTASAPPVSVPSRPKLTQDLTDINVELDYLQVATQQDQVVVFFKILNKSSKDLAIALGDHSAFVTDNRGFSYQCNESSGIGRGVYEWTYIPVGAIHTVSMRCYQGGSRPQRDSNYAISAEAILAPREDVERFGRGHLISSRRTVNISIHGIKAD